MVSRGQLKGHDRSRAVDVEAVCSIKKAEPVDQLGLVVLPRTVPNVDDGRDARGLHHIDPD